MTETEARAESAPASGAPKPPDSVRSSSSLRLQRVTASRVQPLVRLKLSKVKAHGNRVHPTELEIPDTRRRQPAVLPTPRWALQYLKKNLPANPTAEEKERLRQETIDPFLRDRPRKGVPKKVWMALPVVLVITWLLQLLSLGIDAATKSWTLHGVVPEYYDYSVNAMVYSLFNPTYEQGQAVATSVNVYITFIISVVLSIIGLVLNFASDRITENVTSLIFKDRFVISGLTMTLFICISSLWQYDTISESYTPHFGICESDFSPPPVIPRLTSSQSSKSSSRARSWCSCSRTSCTSSLSSTSRRS